VWRQRDTLLKNRGMRIQMVQENQTQKKRPLRTEVGNDLGINEDEDACPKEQR
jgi:hypothetical protein